MSKRPAEEAASTAAGKGMKTFSEIMLCQHQKEVDRAQERLDWILKEAPKNEMTVGQREARNLDHLKQVLTEADETSPRAADTIRWLIRLSVMDAQRMQDFAMVLEALKPISDAPKTPSAVDALQVIADMPIAPTEYQEHGREDAYRAVEALFDDPPYIEVSEKKETA